MIAVGPMSNVTDISVTVLKPLPRAAHILVVEDSQTLRLALCAYLKERGWNVSGAATPEEALARLKKPLMKIDLVFTGIELAGGTGGLLLANWMRQNRPGIPVFLAGGGTAETIKMADTLAPGGPFFIRPYDFGADARMIGQVLAAHQNG
jgi:DNA-binding NtrC family response regulator